MLTSTVFPWIQYAIAFLTSIVILMMVLRMVLIAADPNPFSLLGRFASRFRKATESPVKPFASIFARLRINTKFAPIGVIITAVLTAWFVGSVTISLFSTIDGVVRSVIAVEILKVLGYLLSGFIGLLYLMIVLRVLLSWISPGRSLPMRILMKYTDPVLRPFQAIIPTIGAIDISPLVVLLFLGFLQNAIRGIFSL